jgi:polysaccharide pyruvyl transferase WcaK-like protein
MLRLLHIGIHNSKNKNAGDTVLFPVVRKLFEQQLKDCVWEYRQLWDNFDVEDAIAANQKFDAIIIGGGGLLLRDQAGSDTGNSGWQWNSEIAAIEALNIPLLIFAIGYNRFRNQEDFNQIFSNHITATLRSSVFFSLRNNGSIAAMRNYLPIDLVEKMCVQQCPTTLLWQLYPHERTKAEAQSATLHTGARKPILTINAAFDRENLRFGNKKSSFLEILAISIKRAQEKGWQIHLVAHKEKDLEVGPYLTAADVSFVTFNLTNSPHMEVIDYYTQPDLVIGMRGHAQMIPFGLRKPIFSIVSHDKLKFFLDDLGHPEWGCDINNTNFSDVIDAFIDRIADEPNNLNDLVSKAQTLCWERTLQNIETISEIF